ncbi:MULTISPECIES: ABC transporter ATP-binding protein [unclassified Bacillus (in: firmicutes)]|uniref:ABC transporter ATP-binding protein n=1 Tax=unclassified Bacillus (in: firmicutes) TaxID=185979 RepID=UPI000B872298|nr:MULTISPECIES: ABC transporter ATP-binding protein [unclassified Bacillus (in: firmicutes)]
MQKFIPFLKPYRLHIGIALFLMLAELTVELVQPLLMAKIIDEGIMKKDLSVVMYWGGILLGISLLAFIGGILSSFFAGHTSQGFGYEVRKSLFEKVQSFSFSNFNRFPTSSLITRLTNDVTQVQNTVFMSLRVMMRAPLLVLGGLVMALALNLKLGSILVATVPFLILFLIWSMGRAIKLFSSIQNKLDKVNVVMRENLSGMRLVKAYMRGSHENKRFRGANEQLMDRTISSFWLIESTTPLLLLVMNGSLIALLWFGSVHVNTGEVKVGEVVALINYATRMTSALSVFSMIVMVFSRAKSSGQRIMEVMDTEVDMKNREYGPSEDHVIRAGKVEFRNVSFQYPESEERVLSDISFTVHAGQSVAVLGATGSGKTTLFQLIPRLYDVCDGQILIDDQDITAYKQEILRKSMGFVPQESLLFTGSIAGNIAWGKEAATESEVIEAAKDAQIHETIIKLPKKYETRVGQKGVNLSGGQKQRIAIARALIRKPAILLLDDSTSALDMKTEAELLKALNKYACTTFMITQKMSTAMNADVILLLEGGKLLAKGSHQELLDEVQLYQDIFHSQFGEEGMKSVQGIK